MVDCAAGFTSSSDAVPGADDALFEKYMQVVKVATENCVRCEDLERLAKQLRERDYARKNEQRKCKLKDVLTEMDVANVQEVDKISNTLSTTKLDGGVDADVRTVALGIWTNVLALPCLSEFFTPTFKTYTIFLKRLVGYLPEVASDEYNHASRMLCAMQALGDASQALRALGHTPAIIAQHAGVHDVVKRVDREILKATPLHKKPTPSCQKNKDACSEFLANAVLLRKEVAQEVADGQKRIVVAVVAALGDSMNGDDYSTAWDKVSASLVDWTGFKSKVTECLLKIDDQGLEKSASNLNKELEPNIYTQIPYIRVEIHKNPHI
jgi:hypothetical protein